MRTWTVAYSFQLPDEGVMVVEAESAREAADKAMSDLVDAFTANAQVGWVEEGED